MPYFRFIIIVSSKTLSKIFQMATATFFGRMPSKDDSKISMAGLLSLYWVFIGGSVIFPEAADIFIPFLPEDETIIFIASLSLFLLLPLVVGYITSRVENQRHRSTFVQMMKGYPYTFLVGFLVIGLVIIVPIIKFPQIIKLRSLKHMAVMVKKGQYDEALKAVKATLNEYNIDFHVQDPPGYLWWPFVILTWVQASIFNRQMAKRMKILKGELNGETVEIILHATDLSIIGSEKEVMQVMGMLAEGIDEHYLYFSWDDSSQKVEDQIYHWQQQLADGETIPVEDIESVLQELRTLPLSMDEWNAIRRQLYRVERDNYKNKCVEPL
ncbi:hypothetical protein B0H94_10518 [Salsuginibacillus halophilus]|uniref:Uncharacterized protein n=1 Tax=Salsuginibacillus halophilus TaxID=517424 RepID=A0A2P8HKW8_9BACI|nr:hypothetical protein [Salsuginibacillus halophilus]PSL46868.1 hypothetical protein B0H94_10518 [Salsuginibacillus halophilus]